MLSCALLGSQTSKHKCFQHPSEEVLQCVSCGQEEFIKYRKKCASLIEGLGTSVVSRDSAIQGEREEKKRGA